MFVRLFVLLVVGWLLITFTAQITAYAMMLAQLVASHVNITIS